MIFPVVIFWESLGTFAVCWSYVNLSYVKGINYSFFVSASFFQLLSVFLSFLNKEVYMQIK